MEVKESSAARPAAAKSAEAERLKGLMVCYQQADEAATADPVSSVSPMLLRFLAGPVQTRSRAEDVRRHLAECDSCRRLYELADSAEVSQGAQDTIAASLSPVRPLLGRAILALGFLAIFGLWFRLALPCTWARSGPKA